ncbi:MAG: glycoside hydrolase family 16 protein [Marmoricola sp.]|nr:glycoside hydrolase family 16 protein [Marmoricola sp.]
MFRVFLLLVTVSLVLVIADWQGLLDGTHHGGSLVSNSNAGHNGSVFDRPDLTITSAPTQLSLKQPGVVEVQAAAPAAPGDRILLETAGAMGLGYNEVSEAILDDNLHATLMVAGRDYKGSYNYWAMMPATGDYQQGRSATFAITIGAAAAPPPPPTSGPDAPTCGGVSPEKADGSPWQCTYDDEFNGDDLDRTYWVPQTGGSTTGTGSTYACAVDSPDTVDVANGYLDLSLVKLPAERACTRRKSSQYEFGQVMHYQTFSQTYGKFEVRAKVPDLQVPGVQESFWLWPKANSYGPWPASGEIDFAEMYSGQPGLDRPYLHYLPGETTAGTNDNVTHNNCQINAGEFNTYGVEWEPKEISVLLNGQICFTDDYSSATSFNGETAPFDKPFYLALNQAMGALGNEYDPAVVPDKVTTQIDYVRIWK